MSFNMQRMREDIAKVLEVSPTSVADDDDLIALGLDSIAIMRLAGSWRRAGIEFSYDELMREPVLATWWRLGQQRTTTGTPPAQRVAESNLDEPFALAPMQQAYWIGANEQQVRGAVNAHYYLELEGQALNVERLEQAVRALFARHAMLRTRFLKNGTQQTMPAATWSGLQVHQHAGQTRAEIETALQTLRERLAQRRMNVEAGEVFDVQVSAISQHQFRIHLNVDMLVCDGRSFQNLLNELALLYADPAVQLPPIRYSFKQYLHDLAASRQASRSRAEAYWKARLDDMPSRPELPRATQLIELEKPRTSRRSHWFDAEQLRRIGARAKAHGLTLSSVMASAFCEVIGTWSPTPRFLLNMPLFEREELHPDVGRLVGDFTNVLVVAVDLSARLPFPEQAKRLQLQILADASNAEYSGVEVLRNLARQRGEEWLVAPIVFTSVLGLGDLFSANVRSNLGKPIWISSQTPQVWLDSQVLESDGGLLVNWDCVDELFAAGVVDAMFHAFLGVLRWLADCDDWSEAPPVRQMRNDSSPVDCGARALAQWSGELLHSAFFAHARRTPQRVALRWGLNGELSYGALAERALVIAAALVNHGIEAGDTVAVMLRRGPEQIAAVLGILAAGAVYVPLGVDQPAARKEQMICAAGVKLVLASRTDADAQSGLGSAVPIYIEDCATGKALTAPRTPATDAAAYVIFTSGSTGIPKGVEVAHRSAMNTILDINSRFAVTSEDCVLAVSSLEFDLSVYDIFGLLSAGGSISILEEGTHKEASIWLEHLRTHQVTIWNSVPALFEMLLVAAQARDQQLSLRLALISGDWIGLALPAQCREQARACRFVALGGATEAAIWSNCFEVQEVSRSWRSIPYGKPLHGQKFRVVDWRGRDCPDWVAGELWIGGRGVANGYRGDPERSRERFVEHGAERWYRTGDLGRYLPDGNIELLGRNDSQVKINGYRIDLGEIEAALAGHPGVRNVAAVVTNLPHPRLAALVACTNSLVTASDLMAQARSRLPGYMLPEQIVLAHELPLTSNGKVDRKRIAGMMAPSVAAEPAPCSLTASESQLALLWREVLGVDREIGAADSFFRLGGDSLQATRMLAEVRKRFGVEVLLHQLLEARTLRGFAGLVDLQQHDFEEGVV